MSTFLRAGAAVREFSDTERVVGEEEGRVEMTEGSDRAMLPFEQCSRSSSTWRVNVRRNVGPGV
jgi:hypothetical protein